MIQFVAGVAVGVAGMIVKDKFLGGENTQQKNTQNIELETLFAENEKYRKRNKEMERQIEDLLAESSKLRKDYKKKDEGYDDMEDDLQSARGEVKKLFAKNEDLSLKLQEYKSACEAHEATIAMLKDKMG